MTIKKLCIGIFCAVLLTGCSIPKVLTDEQIFSLLDEYEKQSEALKQYQAAQKEKGVHLAKIENPSAPLDQQLVSVNLERADLAFVLQRLGINYSLIDLKSIRAHVSIKFNNLPMQQALDLLLSPAQLRANIIGQLVTISPLPEIELKPKAGTDFVFKKQVLRYADTRTLEPILSELLITSESDDDDDDEYDLDFDFDDDDDGEDSSGSSSGTTQRLSITAIHSQNAILIKGSSADVNNALDILKSLDTDSGHILIEALVLEFSIDHFLQIGSAISAGSSGQFSEVSIDWASLIGETIGFTKMAGATNTRAFKAAISMLIQHDFGRVISRPYLATISGKEAKIEVMEDRYVTTFQGYGDEVTLEPVSSGIILTITPFLLPDEQIRLDIHINATQFIPSLRNVSLTRSRSEATSTIRIGAGQTLVIGGLMKEEASSSGAGVPGVRDVPGLGFLFGRKQSIVGKRRVLIYITPYLWEPGMDSPVDSRLRLEDFMKSQKDF